MQYILSHEETFDTDNIEHCSNTDMVVICYKECISIEVWHDGGRGIKIEQKFIVLTMPPRENYTPVNNYVDLTTKYQQGYTSVKKHKEEEKK